MIGLDAAGVAELALVDLVGGTGRKLVENFQVAGLAEIGQRRPTMAHQYGRVDGAARLGHHRQLHVLFA